MRDTSIVICDTCKLRYGKYWTFNDYPEYVEKERKRHNCRLIHRCKEWMAVYKQWFYVNPKCRGEDDGPPTDSEERDALVDAEERVIEAKSVFRVRLNAYEDAEARASSRTFAASLADDKVRDVRAHADVVEADYRVAVADHERAATAHGHRGPDAPRQCRRDLGPAAHADVAATGERVRRAAALRRIALEAVAAAVDRASVARRAADCALEAVRVRGEALVRAMDELASHAARAGVRLPELPEPGHPDGDGRIVFMGHLHPYYNVYDVRDEEQDVDHGRDEFHGTRES